MLVSNHKRCKLKICTKCKILLPRANFYVKDKGKSISSKCKVCTCEGHKQKRKNSYVEPENVILLKENKRRCSVCAIVKSTSDFYAKRDSFEGVCKCCKNSTIKERNSNNPNYRENTKAARLKFLEQNPDAYQKSLEYSRRYYRENKEKHHKWVKDWYARNPGKNTEYFRKWRLANLDVSTFHAQKRRAQKLRATPSWAVYEEQEIRDVYKISKEMSSGDIKFNVDHIVPLQSEFVCGFHCLANLRILTSSDNFIKSNKHWPDMW